MSKRPKQNGRRRWRHACKKMRQHEGSSYTAAEARRNRKRPGFVDLPPLPSPPWSARSLVGMSESAKKRAAVVATNDLAMWTSDENWLSTYARQRSLYHVGERLRLCPGCFECCRHMQGYGFFPGGDPRDFTPDEESSPEAEQALHAEHCAAWERGERPRVKTSGVEWTDEIKTTDKDGKPTTIPAGYKFVSRSAYGPGSYQIGRKRSCNGSEVVPARKAVRS